MYKPTFRLRIFSFYTVSMSLSPTSGIGKLSLESISRSSKPQVEMDISRGEPAHGSVEGGGLDVDDSSVSGDSDGGSPSIIQSPTGLKYNIGHLSGDTQEIVRSLFSGVLEEPFEMALKWCDRLGNQEGDDEAFYAFQLAEVVPRSIRIGSPQSRYRVPECRCGTKPCKHLIWLSDLIASQVLHGRDPEEPLTLNEQGYADELGSPFNRISEMRLDVLADGLHCDIGYPAANLRPSATRRLDILEILASVADVDEWDPADYRPDLQSDAFDHTALIHRADPEATLFSLLLASSGLASWLRSQLRASDPPLDPFRQIYRRVTRIILDLEEFSASCRAATDPASLGLGSSYVDAEGPRDVAWAALSITRCVDQIRDAVVTRREEPLAGWERASAARALVRILRTVVEKNFDMHSGPSPDDRNLYARLIGNRDTGFVCDTLDLLVDQNQFVEELEDILELVGISGVVDSWWNSMKRVVAKMRSWKGPGSSRNKGKGVPPRGPGMPERSGDTGRTSTSTQTVNPPTTHSSDMPLPTVETESASARRSGQTSGAGSKRPGVGTESEPGAKRAK